MEIKDKKINDIFTKNSGADRFTIPDYQRSYIWSEDQVEEYYNDLINNKKIGLPFVGSFIFQRKGEKDYDVVDGQQRLITTAILIAAIRDVAKNIKNEFDEEVEESLENISTSAQAHLTDTNHAGKVKGGYVLKVWGNQEDFFNNYILNNNKKIEELKIPTKKENLTKFNIIKNYHKLTELIKNSLKEERQAPDDFLNTLLTDLGDTKIVAIYVDKDEEAYTAFEITNARGQELGNIDLLKNLFYKSASTEKDDLEWMKKQWNNIIDNIKESSIPKINSETFLRTFWHSYYGGSKFSTSKVIFVRFKDYIQEKGYKKVTEQMLQSSELIKSFGELIENEWVDDRRYDKKISNSLRFLKEFKITQAYTLFLSIMRNEIDPKKVKNIVEATEKFHFAYSAIAKKSPNRVEKLYGQYAEKFEKANKNDQNEIGTIYNQFLNELIELFPKESEFLDNFYELSYQKKKELIRYVFYKIHDHCADGATSVNFESTNANLEHINSQKQQDGFVLDNKMLHSIGNIIPLSKKDNSKAGNKNLKEKIQEYKNSGKVIPITNKVIEMIEKNDYNWQQKDIENWAEYLGKEIYKITRSLN